MERNAERARGPEGRGEEVAGGLARLSEWSAALSWPDVPERVRHRVVIARRAAERRVDRGSFA